MKNHIHELVKDAIENYFLRADLSEIIGFIVREELDNMDIERIIRDSLDIEAVIYDELDEVLEELFE